MAVLVTILTVVVALLALLVVGLLRSHAAILKQLHELGAGVGDPARPASVKTPVEFSMQSGLPTLSGDMVQTAAQTLSGPLAGQKFGRKGTRLRFFATGLGHKLSDAPTAQLEIAGNWSIE